MLLIHAGSRDWDEGVYWQSIRALVRGEPLFRSVYASQPPAFYYALVPLYLLSHSLAALRISVLFFAVVGLVAGYWAARSLAGFPAAVIALLLLATSPMYIHEAAIVQADMPSAAMTLLALALTLAATRASRIVATRLAVLAGLALAVAIGAKFFGLLAILPIGLLLITPRRQPFRVLLGFAAGLLAGLVLVMVPAFPALGAAYQQMIGGHVAATRTVYASFGGNLSVLLRAGALPLIGVTILAAAIAIQRRDPRIIAPLAWSSLGTIALLLYQPLYPHHVLLLVPALALTVAVGFADLAAWRPGWVAPSTAMATLAAAIGLVIGLQDAQHALIPNGRDVALATAIEAASLPGQYVISDNPYAVALANRDLPGPMVDTSGARTAAGLLTTAGLDTAKDDYGVTVILTDSGRLQGVPGFSRWLASDFRQVRPIGPHASLYAARPEPN